MESVPVVVISERMYMQNKDIFREKGPICNDVIYMLKIV